jgi:uncharacterized membrane protein YvbJ
MICPNCGASKEEDANFCRKCGYKFASDQIEDYRDSYQINVGVSIAIGMASSIITGIFSAAISEIIHLEWWGWCIILLITSIMIVILFYRSFKTVEKSAIRQLRRAKNRNAGD